MGFSNDCAGIVLPFVVVFVWSAPAQYAQQERNRVRFESYKADGKRIDLVFETVGTMVKKVKAALAFYQTNAAGKEWPEPTDKTVVISGFTLASTAREQTTMAVGLFRGLRLDDEKLDNMREQFKQAAERLDAIVSVVERFYLTHSIGDATKVKAMLPDLRKASSDNSQVAMELLTITSDFTDRANRITDERSIEIVEQTDDVKLLKVKEWAVIVCVIYVFLFGVALVVRFVQPQKKKRVIGL